MLIDCLMGLTGLLLALWQVLRAPIEIALELLFVKDVLYSTRSPQVA